MELTKSQIENVISWTNKISSDDLKIDALSHEIRRLKEELQIERSNFKAFRKVARNNARQDISDMNYMEDIGDICTDYDAGDFYK